MGAGRRPWLPKTALDWTQEDYEAEWRDVVQFHGVTSRDEYLEVSRAGCSKPLIRAERARIWDGLSAFPALRRSNEMQEDPHRDRHELT